MKFWNGPKPVDNMVKHWRTLYSDLLLNYKHNVGAEIGVGSGPNTVNLCKSLPNLEKLYAIDPFEYYPDFDKQIKAVNRDYEGHYKIFLSNIAPYKDKIKVIRKRSSDAAELIEDNSLDFVFIDGNHLYEYVKEDILLWAPKVKWGGIISGHDYTSDPDDVGKQWFHGVKKAVDELIPYANIVVEAAVWWIKKDMEIKSMPNEHRLFKLTHGQQSPIGSTGILLPSAHMYMWIGPSGTFPKRVKLGKRNSSDPVFDTNYINRPATKDEVKEYYSILNAPIEDY